MTKSQAWIGGASFLIAGFLLSPLSHASGVTLAVWKISGIVVLSAFALTERTPLIAAALALSTVGDFLLALGDAFFTQGLVAFAVAHVVYASFFFGRLKRNGRRPQGPALALCVVGFALLMGVWLAPGMGDMFVPATLYLAVIATMASLAVTARGPAWSGIGAALFLISDSLVAAGKFRGLYAEGSYPAFFAVWATYGAAQVLLTLGALEVRKR